VNDEFPAAPVADVSRPRSSYPKFSLVAFDAVPVVKVGLGLGEPVDDRVFDVVAEVTSPSRL
jgi:hypothetical protein